MQNRKAPKATNIDFKAFSLFGNKGKSVIKKLSSLFGIELTRSVLVSCCYMLNVLLCTMLLGSQSVLMQEAACSKGEFQWLFFSLLIILLSLMIHFPITTHPLYFSCCFLNFAARVHVDLLVYLIMRRLVRNVFLLVRLLSNIFFRLAFISISRRFSKQWNVIK